MDSHKPIRKRASIACDTCRRQKEKCEGGAPCWRCQRLGRQCTVKGQTLSLSRQTPSDVRDAGKQSTSRVEGLEQIARHFLGNVSLDEENVRRIVSRLGRTPLGESQNVVESFDVQFVASDTAHYSGEFSHWNFSQKLRRRIGRIERFGIKEYWRPTQLQSSTHLVSAAVSHLPPRSITEFLLSMFFKYATLNVFYIEESWIKERVARCYNSAAVYSLADTPWVCSLFAVLAIGTQVAHMEGEQAEAEDSTLCSEDSVGLSLYHTACRLIPDVLLVASHESVQAFLLLALYALPVSTGGLSYSYLGIAVKMAIQNGMHRKYTGEGDPHIIETRNRIFWTACTMDRRISILHGRPASIAKPDISADFPSDTPSFASPNYANMMAFIKLNSWLGEVAETLTLLRNCPKRFISGYLNRLLQLRSDITQWWSALPSSIEGKDMALSSYLFRQNAHLKLTYLLVFIYMGRPFMFADDWKLPARDDETTSPSARVTRNDEKTDNDPKTVLVHVCVKSALETLSKLQTMSKYTGLCRASYTEFSSCRAALLVILADRLNARTLKYQDEFEQGMAMIRRMVGGCSSESEISYLQSLDAAIRTSLDSDLVADTDAGMETSTYSQFKQWTNTMKADANTGGVADLEISSFSPFSFMDPKARERTDCGGSMDIINTWREDFGHDAT
ncbi:Zn(II)2Cys6 transcription factor [Aspergillus mulundensis]|uniref:Zn(2)-C6 fungal-type domain-containing protein n=1 Tax=Aspergillus mulundensis TaxID=1810919 RepID=A0A3D8R4S6_9EURO|nr:Uncharacterized protein DSM5745_08746 [Aspergillus mulundensis]RDW68986.1 Uncharacterized protein DSM5745_08746 [Aspergillus mulundensis]